MGKVYFPNYENFSDVNKAYENFFQKLMSVIDKLAPFKTKRVKSNSQEWFHGERSSRKLCFVEAGNYYHKALLLDVVSALDLPLYSPTR